MEFRQKDMHEGTQTRLQGIPEQRSLQYSQVLGHGSSSKDVHRQEKADQKAQDRMRK